MAEMLATAFQRLAAPPTALGLASRLALSRIKQENIDPLPLLKRTNLTQAALDERKRISIASQINFLGEASRVLNDDWLGLTLAQRFDLREIGMIYYVAAAANSFGDALRRIVRYGTVVSEAWELRIDSRGVTAHLEIFYRGFSRHTDRHQAEFVALVLLRIFRKLIGRRIVPIAATFVHHRSGNAAQIRSLFGCDVQFDALRDKLSFDAALLDLPVFDGDPYLNDLMVKLCEEAIATRTSNVSPLRALVENTVAPLLPHGEASAKNVARKIGLSERTFARRLASEGMSFGGILDDLRRELAVSYLQDGLQASQITWMLGFSQNSSFTHACRRWTGKKPSELRHIQTLR
ncbi:AraC-like DNA-binding protein [Pararhizobium capsulatum DSM 1112]|uniref:AraC-like DNA-binding protein n=1 Tax=Pararhizobium capsulatum DSM 1112 TaxID=1121113 RepID=A0ABU0BYQ0_9HYPH|nr:AraC family transcriptional regulator [Pararhizobium capsulatum]MDQ0323396.1 AraC-like DNA-binding protein [Pararhizobium capsulatum DSM 1112]